jgi:hypothetical protein
MGDARQPSALREPKSTWAASGTVDRAGNLNLIEKN